MAMRKPLVRAILDGAQQIAAPAFVSTLSICIVFVPVLLLTGAAQVPVHAAGDGGGLRDDGVVLPLAHADPDHGALPAAPGGEALRAWASMAKRPAARASSGACTTSSTAASSGCARPTPRCSHWCARSSRAGAGGLRALRRRLAVPGAVHRPRLLPDRRRRPDAAARARPAGTRIEETELIFAEIEDEIRQVIPPREIDTIIDNIGIPNGGFNLAFGDSPTHRRRRRRDPDLAEARGARLHRRVHRPPAQAPAREVSRRDVLLRGRQHHQPDSELRPARAHRRAGGRAATPRRTTRSRSELAARRSRAFPARPTCTFTRWWTIRRSDVNVDRSKAGQVGLTQRDVASSLLISLSASGQIAPTSGSTGATASATTSPCRRRSTRSTRSTRCCGRRSARRHGVNTNTRLAGRRANAATRRRRGPSQTSLAYGNPGAQSADRSCSRTSRRDARRRAGDRQPLQRAAGVRRLRQRGPPRPGQRRRGGREDRGRS